MVKLIFYKGKGRLFDKLIRLWTRSKYSHVELWVDGVSYTASANDNMVTGFIKPVINPEKWDVVEVPSISEARVTGFYQATKGQKYDWVGIMFHEFLPFKKHKADAWYCSEWCAAAIGLPVPQMSPKQLAQHFGLE